MSGLKNKSQMSHNLKVVGAQEVLHLNTRVEREVETTVQQPGLS